MKLEEGARFVGVYASFPVQQDKRRVQILKSFLGLEDELSLKRIRYGPIRGKLSTVSFNKEKLGVAIDSIERGDSDFLQLFPYKVGEDWVREYETSIHLDWESSIVRPIDRPRSPVEERFGDAGSIRVGYPQSRFLADSESSFQKRLLGLMRKLWAESKLHWAFIHQGFHQLRPYSVGQDDVFRVTRDGFPITSFDQNLATARSLYKEYVGGAFWANFLNPFHVARLGGVEKILQERPCEIIEHLGKEEVLLQVAISPITNETVRSIQNYQRLRRFLAPILMETGEDMIRIQKEILGSWTPPADAARKWQGDLAIIRKQYP